MAKIKVEQNEIKIGTELGVIIIQENIKDAKDRLVTTIEIIPNKHSGEHNIKATPCKLVRLIRMKIPNR